MTVKVAENELLLDALMEDPDVKAAVLVDNRGYVIEQRKTTASLKTGKASVRQRSDTSPGPPTENLYLVEAGDDFLIVVFDERVNFEKVKSSVDATLGEFDMEPVQE